MSKFGPPLPKPRPYPHTLEVLEAQANKTLTAEYAADVKLWLAVLEAQLLVNPQMIDIQPEIQWYMRPYLLDFIIELHSLFRLQPLTLFLCVNIIDRYCAKRIVFKRHYQLVGCTALWIAGKYEDKKLRVPTLRELAVMCRQAYDEEMFVQMEMHILLTLEWLLSHPLLEDCLQLAIAEAGVSANVTPCKYNRPDAQSLKILAVTAVGRFFCELSLYDRFFLSVPTSLIAVTANLLACAMLGVPTAAAHLTSLLDALPVHRLLAGDENVAPPVHGAFLSGFDGHAMHLIRRIAVVLLANTKDLSEVLQRKHEGLGVIPVVHNFSNRHSDIMHFFAEHGQDLAADEAVGPLLPQMQHSVDTVLQLVFRKWAPPMVPRPSVLPLTPPLASQSLIFSHVDTLAYATPILHSDGVFSAYSPTEDARWALPMAASKLRV